MENCVSESRAEYGAVCPSVFAFVDVHNKKSNAITAISASGYKTNVYWNVVKLLND